MPCNGKRLVAIPIAVRIGAFQVGLGNEGACVHAGTKSTKLNARERLVGFLLDLTRSGLQNAVCGSKRASHTVWQFHSIDRYRRLQ